MGRIRCLVHLTHKELQIYSDGRSCGIVTSLKQHVYIQSVICMCCFGIKIHSRHYVTAGNTNFLEYKVKGYDFEPLAPSNTIETSDFGSFGEVQQCRIVAIDIDTADAYGPDKDKDP